MTSYGRIWRGFLPNARHYLLFLLVCGSALSIYGLLFNLYLLELGFDEAFVGQAVGAGSLGTMVGAIPAGLLYTRRGGRAVFVLNATGTALTWAVLMVVRQPLWLLAASFVNGAAGALLYTAAYPFMADETTDRERPYIFSLNAAGWTVADMVGRLAGGLLPPLLLPVLPRLADAYRASILSAAALTLLGLLPALAIRPRAAPPTPTAAPTATASDADAADRRGFVGGGLSIVAIGLTIGLSSSFYNVYFHQFHGVGTGPLGGIFFLSSLFGVSSFFAMPAIVERFGLVRGVMACGLASAPFLWLLGQPVALPVAIGGYLLASLFTRFATFLIYNLIMEVVSAGQRGRMASVRVVTNYLTYAVSGVVGGWLIVQRGYSALFTLAAAAGVLTAAVVWAFFRGWQRRA